MSASTTPEPSTMRLSLSEMRPLTVPWMTRSSSPEISPSIMMDEPITVLAMCAGSIRTRRPEGKGESRSVPSNSVGQLDVHVDASVEACAIFDDHARRTDVALDLGAGGDGHAL